MDPETQTAFNQVKQKATPRAVTKVVVGFVVGHAAAHVSRVILRNTYGEPESRADQARIRLASYAIGGVVSHAAQKTTDDDIDQLFDIIEKFQKARKKTAPETHETIVVPPSE